METKNNIANFWRNFLTFTKENTIFNLPFLTKICTRYPISIPKKIIKKERMSCSINNNYPLHIMTLCDHNCSILKMKTAIHIYCQWCSILRGSFPIKYAANVFTASADASRNSQELDFSTPATPASACISANENYWL